MKRTLYKIVILNLHIILYLSVLFAFSACQKEDDPNTPTETNNDPDTNKDNCLVNTVITSGGAESVLNINYDDEGRISIVNREGITVTYSYSGNRIIILSVEEYKLLLTTSIELNEQGWVQQVTSVYNDEEGNASAPIVETYEYNEKGEVQKKIRQAGNNAPTTNVYIWNEGNMVSESDGVTYEYYADQPVQEGDPLRQIDILNTGMIVFRNKNLVSRITNNNTGTVEGITYDFDGDGKISKINLLITGISITRTIHYLCE